MVIDYDPLKKFLRRSAGIDIDKSDMKRLNDLIGSKLNDLLVIGVRNASYNDRDIVMEPDLPLTKGFLERRQEFRKFDEAMGLKPILEHLATIELPFEGQAFAFDPSRSGVLFGITREDHVVVSAKLP